MAHTNDDFFRVLGHISVFFATLDFFVTELILYLVRRDRPVEDLKHMTLGRKFRYLGRLEPDEVVDAGCLGRIRVALPEALKISKARNRYIHDQWLFDDENIRKGKIVLASLGINRVPWGHSYTTTRETLELKDLYAFLNSVGAQQKIFFGFLEELFAQRASKPVESQFEAE